MATIFVCGDVVNQEHNECFIGESLAGIIRMADYSVCNFEGPELMPGEKATFPHQGAGTAAYLKSVGFDLMLLANNHITEQGAKGIRNSIRAIESVNASYIGVGFSWEDAYKPLIKDIAGIRFGFLNVCEAQEGQFISQDQPYGYAWMGYDSLFTDIESLARVVDFVVVFVHAGLEHYDLPLPEIRSFYRRICDAGASAVVGSHPHCAQGFEYYGAKPIIYSLGNFFFPPRDRWPIEVFSYSVLLRFEKGKSIDVKPVLHHNGGNRVELTEELMIDVDALNNKLDYDYENESKQIIVTAYESLCKRLLLEATCGQNERDDLRTVVGNALRYTFKRKKYVQETKQRREALLRRLFINETYRYIIINALKNECFD